MSDLVVAAVWADATSRTRLTIVKAVTNPCSILTALAGMSNAIIVENYDHTIDGPIGTGPTPAAFASVAEWAQFIWSTGANAQLRLTLPAPKASIFFADMRTVDPSMCGPLITACVGNLSNGVGLTATALISARLMPDRSDLDPIS